MRGANEAIRSPLSTPGWHDDLQPIHAFDAREALAVRHDRQVDLLTAGGSLSELVVGVV